MYNNLIGIKIMGCYTAASFQLQGRKRIAVTEADHTEVLAKRFQAAFSGENKTFVVAKADV